MYIKKVKDGLAYFHDGGNIDELQAKMILNDQYKNGGEISKTKAKEILRDGTAHGHPLSTAQKGYFGLIAGGGKPNKKAMGGLAGKKYADGGDIKFTVPDIDPNYIPDGLEDNPVDTPTTADRERYLGEDPSTSKIPSGLSTNSTVAPNRGSGFNFGDFAKNNQGDIINTTNYLLNKKDINSLQTSPSYQKLSNPYYTYTDRSGLAKRDLGEGLRTASKGLSSASSTGDAANAQAGYAQYVRGLGNITQQENERKDSYNRDYYGKLFDVSKYNTGLANQAAADKMGAENKKVMLGTEARNAFLEGYKGNRVSDQQRKYQDEVLGIEKAKTSGMGQLYNAFTIDSYLNNPNSDSSILKNSNVTDDDIKNYYQIASPQKKIMIRNKFPQISFQ